MGIDQHRGVLPRVRIAHVKASAGRELCARASFFRFDPNRPQHPAIGVGAGSGTVCRYGD